MKRLSILFCFLSCMLHAQTDWVHDVGSIANDEPQDVCKDNQGDFVLVGYFSGVMNLKNIMLTPTSIGLADAFIYKTDRSGVIKWAIHFGGYGFDKAIAVTTDIQNNIYVAGTYQGTVQFGSFSLTSINSTEDIFVAKLSPAGSFIWARSAGGTMLDQPNDITLDNNKNVFITGQFSGISTFGSTTLTSMNDPNSGLPSVDVFTTKLSNSGSFLWTRQGAAKYTDRGKALCADNGGNIYVCGQFSDTITFNQVYDNNVFNALFFIKYDSLGNEVWLKKGSGYYSMPNDIIIDQQQNIYMTGDFEGLFTFYNVPGTISTGGNYNYKYFISKFNTSGNLLWIKQQASSSEVSSKKIALDANNNPYIFGEFKCRFNDFANIHGQGTFCSVGYEDLFIAKYHYSGARLWENNWGGQKTDKAYGIAIDSIDKPLLASSFYYGIDFKKKYNYYSYYNFYSDTNSITYPFNYCGSVFVPDNIKCNDSAYYWNIYEFGARGSGADIFFGKYVSTDNYPYDYFYYGNDQSCNFPFLNACVSKMNYECYGDTQNVCQSPLYCYTHNFTNCDGEYNPIYKYQWSTGDSSKSIYPNVTGWYNVTATTEDGCFANTDSAYIIIRTPPQAPLISDELGVNILHPPVADSVIACRDSIKLWSDSISGCSIYWNEYSWSYPKNFHTHDSTIIVFTEDLYYVSFMDSLGCTSTNQVYVWPAKPVNLILKNGMPDTISACYGQ